ncbi:uncharacterized protein L969DRAFT_46206 [Mixia osmundae IAM 14324]|uniref:uncharacterized protein n=1 Tax=Mixia osmundae (strain CBS 9802 / IAM 14324 / JCM 22182 / KY 12970) TaxID=764103 RepID=UPI0004A5482E|nr:uncharacterized protein L969DRAFT_46206 [Mixia osmundae IAM 14324]KEI40978.1 hypothetical protein L969DRAFT_46206 [Mixia osmundae IAM 14324]
MNSLYTLATRQTASISSDLSRWEAGMLSEGERKALIGQVTASLAGLSRTVDDYENMSRRELVQEKQDKALLHVCCLPRRSSLMVINRRVEKFKSEYAELNKKFQDLKAAPESNATSNAFSSGAAHRRSSVSGRNGASSGLAESPFASSASSRYQSGAQSRREALLGHQPQPSTRRIGAALDENSFYNNAGSALDDYIAQGQAILGNLGNQRDMMKGTQRRLLSAANTLGLSRSTISFIERRGKSDSFILAIGAVFVFVSFYFILRWFG